MEIGYCVVFAAVQPYGNWLLCGFCCWAALWKFAILACRSGTCLRMNPTTPLCSSSMLARCHFSKETVFRQCIVVIFGSSIPTCYWTGLGIVLHPCNFLAPLIFTTPAYVETLLYPIYDHEVYMMQLLSHVTFAHAMLEIGVSACWYHVLIRTLLL